MKEATRISKLNSKFAIDENYWAVSLVNTNNTTTGKLLGGHSAIIVEGIERMGPQLSNTRFFYGFYEMRAQFFDTEEDETSSFNVNKKGYISKINVKENHDYPPDWEEKFSRYTVCNTSLIPYHKNTEIVKINDQLKRRNMQAVKNHKNILLVNKRSHYELGFFDKKENKYVQKKIDTDFISSSTEIKYEKEITESEKNAVFDLCAAWSLRTHYKSVRKMIESIKEDQRRIIEIDGDHGAAGNPNKSLYPPYEIIGMHSILGAEGRGKNCSNWCAEKLLIAGIGDGHMKKPGCIIA